MLKLKKKTMRTFDIGQKYVMIILVSSKIQKKKVGICIRFNSRCEIWDCLGVSAAADYDLLHAVAGVWF